MVEELGKYTYVYMEVNKEINLTIWGKVKKTNNPKFDEFIMKVDAERFVVYPHTYTNISGNIIKHNLWTSMNKNISLTLYSQKGWCFWGVWEMSGETYTQREDFFFPYLLPGAWRC